MTRDREKTVQTLQRKMLRLVVGVRRRLEANQDGELILEDWVPWIKCATREAEKMGKMHGIPDGIEEISRRKFRWAGHVARRDDGRWTRVFLDLSLCGYKLHGRPASKIMVCI